MGLRSPVWRTGHNRFLPWVQDQVFERGGNEMMDDNFYDLVYEAWMTGKNPDNVDAERYDHMESRGYYPDEITLSDVYPQKTTEHND